MPRGTPVTDEQRAQVRTLHSEGKGRNEIARITGLNVRTVTDACRKAGLAFDDTNTAKGVQIRRTTLADRRTKLIERLYDQADAALDALELNPYKAIGLARTGEVIVTLIDTVPADDRRSSMAAVSAAMTTAARLEALDAGNGADAAVSMLGKLAAALGVAVKAYDEADAAPSGG